MNDEPSVGTIRFAQTITWPHPYGGADDPLRRPAPVRDEPPVDEATVRRKRLHAVAAALDGVFDGVPDADVRQAIADLLAYSEERR